MRASLFRFIVALGIGVPVVAASAAKAQDWHQGHGRLEGTVQNAKGDPIAGATVAVRLNGAGTDLKTNTVGHWGLLGMTGGSWEIDFSAPGYQSKKINVNVSEMSRIPTVKIQLEPEAPAQAASEGPRTEVRVGGKAISKQAAAALERGNAAMKEKKFADAEENFLKVLPELPDESSLLYTLSLSFYFDGKTDRALEFARKTVAVEPRKADAWLMISELELQKGNLEAGQEALARVPPERITSPEPYVDLGVLSYNKKKYPEADQAFTKAISLKPDFAQAYYYRGLGRFAVKRMPEARADLQKSLELAPSGPDAENAKEVLKSIK
ncbi:MAG: tetratricopeptide repeat protein [Acidobacteriota bacterium]